MVYTSTMACLLDAREERLLEHTSAYVNIRQHTLVIWHACSMLVRSGFSKSMAERRACIREHTVSIRQHTVSIPKRQHTVSIPIPSAYVSIPSAYVSIRIYVGEEQHLAVHAERRASAATCPPPKKMCGKK